MVETTLLRQKTEEMSAVLRSAISGGVPETVEIELLPAVCPTTVLLLGSWASETVVLLTARAYLQAFVCARLRFLEISTYRPLPTDFTGTNPVRRFGNSPQKAVRPPTVTDAKRLPRKVNPRGAATLASLVQKMKEATTITNRDNLLIMGSLSKRRSSRCGGGTVHEIFRQTYEETLLERLSNSEGFTAADGKPLS